MGHYFGFSFGSILLAVGIASLIISTELPADSVLYRCGLGGSPPLRIWIFGTGIAYTIAGGILLVGGIMACTVCGLIPLIVVLYVTPMFVLAWSIVGGVTLWKFGVECYDINFRLWQMGMAAEIISLILVFGMLFGGYRTTRSVL